MILSEHCNMEEGGVSVEGTTTLSTTSTEATTTKGHSLSHQVMADSTNNHQRVHRHSGGSTGVAPVSIDMHKSDGSIGIKSDSGSANSSSSASSHIGSIKNSYDERGINHHSLSELQVRQALQKASSGDESEQSLGLIGAGLGWLQRKREERRQQQLQQQADEQLKKILQAEKHISESENDDMAETTINILTSQSGEGAYGQIDLDLEDDFYVPEVQVKEEPGTPRPYILNQAQMNQIAEFVLPQTISFCRWNRLYDLGRDGDSFEACLRIVGETQRTLMVIRTTKGDVFGGFADCAWAPQPFASAKFYGSATACLFKVIKDDDDQPIRPFKWSGKNRYIQLCDTTRKMLAFGGGGDDGAFGLAVEEDFQRGSTGHCDTFDNEPLCDDGSFQIVDLEIWEFTAVLY